MTRPLLTSNHDHRSHSCLRPRSARARRPVDGTVDQVGLTSSKVELHVDLQLPVLSRRHVQEGRAVVYASVVS
uniref:Uncharacterized protein n=1 Tax=Mycena chlorophos TaxID=658473 RepID=A0ABQ0LHL9_MYCCL|nr:predicted protein [Mycena chlorophos]